MCDFNERITCGYTCSRRNQGNGCWIDKDGYVIYNIFGKHCRVHRMIMEAFLNRPLFYDENVHHKNGNKSDNRLENLQLISKSEHQSKHAKLFLRNQSGNFVAKLYVACG